MNNNQLKKAVLWMTKSGFSLYIEGNSSILTIPFFGESVRYFDVFDEPKLSQQLEDFILKNKLQTLNIYFIIGQDALIEKEFSFNKKDEITQFLELIPYEIVYSKQLKKEKTILVAAFNGDFYRIFKNVFEKYSIKIITLLPYFTVEQSKLDNQTGETIIKKADALKNESMLGNEIKDDTDYIPLVDKSSEEKSSLIYLIPVFIVLIIILVFVVVSSQNQNNASDQNKIPTQTPVIIPTATNYPLSPEPVSSDSADKTATDSAL